MKKWCFILCVASLLLCCKDEKRPEEVAAESACAYYERLLGGDYEGFLGGVAGADSLPGDYRSQLVDNARMFLAVQQREHGGIRSVRVASAKADTASRSVEAYLILCFGDSTNEEIVVPMTERDGRWMMK